MKKLSNEEFIEEIQRLIEGKITKVKLAKELETDTRTLDNKIQELSVTAPEIYRQYLNKFSYKQKQIDHIDFEALIIYMLKQGITLEEVATKFNISRQTISRRINELENEELVRMYREVAYNRKHRMNNDLKLNEDIEQLEYRPVVLREVNGRRKAELLAIEARFNKLCETMDKTQAAKAMGYNDRDRVYKLLNELYKLEIEEYTKKALNIEKTTNKTQEKKEESVKDETIKRPNLEDEGS